MIIRNAPWADDLKYASAAPKVVLPRRDSGMADIVKGIVMGLALGLSAWALLILTFVYFIN